MIFKHLDRCSSMCLGLSSNVLYPIHFSLRGKVPLYSFCVLPRRRKSPSQIKGRLAETDGRFLMDLLMAWMGWRLVIYPTPRRCGDIGVLRIATREIQHELWCRWFNWGVNIKSVEDTPEWSAERREGMIIAKKELGGYEENGVWFYA
jgi:hypothetical protein